MDIKMDSKAYSQADSTTNSTTDSKTDSTTDSKTDPTTDSTTDERAFRGERRRHLRFSLGLVVNVHVSGRPDPVAVEIIDIGAKGARFRLADLAWRAYRTIALEQHAAFGFVVPGQKVCVASGRVMRIAAPSTVASTEFVLSIERANDAFHGFLGSLGGIARSLTCR